MTNLEVEHTVELCISAEHEKPEDRKKLLKLTPWEDSPFQFWWNIIFLLSCIIGVLNDPLFLYIPIINEEKKCLRMDEKLRNAVLVLRTITDLAYLLHIFFRYRSASQMAKKLDVSYWRGFPWFYLLINILAILPIPQVVVIGFFSTMVGSKSSKTSRKFLNGLLLAQYAPRLFRVYITTKELGSSFVTITRSLWVRGTYNFCLYITCGHVFGAFWYFYSIFRETSCWQMACRTSPGCKYDNSFICQSKSAQTKDVQYFSKICSGNDKAVFNFGIFAQTTLTETNFPKKFFKCFWWGLKNLSSFGSNLDTSDYVWENVFAAVISILGSLLFLYLIGNLQTYLGLSTEKAEEVRQKIIEKGPEIDSFLSKYNIADPDGEKKKYIMELKQRKIQEDKRLDWDKILSLFKVRKEDEIEAKEWLIKILEDKPHEINTTEESAERWISESNIYSPDRKKKIIEWARLKLQDGNKDVDIVNILSSLPPSLQTEIKEHLCLNTLQKVPMLQNIDYKTILNYLKPKIYPESSYIIRKGEPIDLVLFITQGVVWSFGETSPMERLKRGDYYGSELIEWKLKSTSYSAFPISTKNVKSHTKVEAFVLLAADLEHLF
ncbi:hypothetical protein UlMin_024692 [Ulmus minor]